MGVHKWVSPLEAGGMILDGVAISEEYRYIAPGHEEATLSRGPEYVQGEAFPGVVGRTISESSPAWAIRARSPEDAPNVVIVLMDNVGFAEFGCYGSAIRTPTFDRLAADGLRYRGFRTAAISGPSRACLLTGRNAHAVGSGSPVGSGFPGYNGMIPRESGFLSEVLRSQGYATFALGKWHLIPPDEETIGSPTTGWPLGRGFDRYYGYINAATDWYAPELVYDNHGIQPPRTPEQGYHLNADLADRAIEFVADLRAVAPHRPFFMYYCPSAGHEAHLVPKEWADEYRGTFDGGWDRYREEIFTRQLEMGIIPEGTRLTGRPDTVPAWDELSADERRVLTRQIEVYAGYITHADHHIARVVDFIDELGELDNTIFLVASDTGASRNGGRHGGNVTEQYGMTPEEIVALNLRQLEEWGGPHSHCHYAAGWAWAGNTPFRGGFAVVHEGGVADPLIVHWPAGIRARGEVRTPYVHATDVVPTVLEALRITPPEMVEGVRQSPIHGVSFAHTFDDAEAATKKSVQYYESVGSRAIWKDGWKAVIEQQRGVLITPETIKQEQWELYRVAEDCSEYTNLADQHPEKLRELVDLWWIEAEKYGVLPLDSRGYSKLSTKLHYGRSERGEAPRTRFVYYPNTASIPSPNAPAVHRRSHQITAEIEVSEPTASGVLVAQGDGSYGGYSLHVNNGRLCYVHNWNGMTEYRIDSKVDLPAGSVTVCYRFEMTGEDKGVGVLYIGDQETGRGEIPKLTSSTAEVSPGYRGAGLSCGYAFGRPPTEDYRPPFRFTGRIRRLVIEVADDESDR